MLCTKFISNKSTCSNSPGGVAKMYIFDPADFDWTQAAPVSGVIQPYTAIADLSTDDPSTLFEVSFQRDEAEYSFKQSSKKGFSTKYEHQVVFTRPGMDMLQTQWAALMDKAGGCCGIGIIVVTNDGLIRILGENSVNGDPLTVPFFFYQDGTTGTTGKKFDDSNAIVPMLKGDYSRAAIYYTGPLSDITAFLPA